MILSADGGDSFEVGAPAAPTLVPADELAGVGPRVDINAEPLSEDIGPPLRPGDPPFDPEPIRERVRSWLAIGPVGWTVALMLAIAAAVLYFRIDVAIAKELATLLITPSLALASAVTGFYFASRR
jgi:hypothetical protein